MLLNPKTPLVFGIAATAALAGYLLVRDPLPEALSGAHALIMPGHDIQMCERCHTAECLTAGCLTCHTEIAGQLEAEQGYHAFVARSETLRCARCHPEHHGNGFSLISALSWPGGDRNAFDHPQCNYRLTGRHEELACEDCHKDKRTEAFHLPEYPDHPRMQTFLGLAQDCLACHVDVHAWPSPKACLDCHDQTAFDPASGFRHEEVFPLEGVHAETDCAGCHTVPATDANGPAPEQRTPGSLPFHKVTGETCEQCHPDPHRTRWDMECQSCHLGRDPQWREGTRGLSAETHKPTGFPLTDAHMAVSCEKCHPASGDYAQRFPDPKTEGYQRHPQTCQGCHEDVHGGKLDHACSACHRESGWTGGHLTFNHDRHTTFKLDAVHKGLSCHECHAPEDKTYRAEGSECAACHQDQADAFNGRARRLHVEADPHANRLACTDCHDMDAPRQYMDRYARRCADCHNNQYGQLAYQWAQVLQRRHSLAERLLSSRTEGVSEQLRQELDAAQECGFHNFTLTRRLYDDLIEALQRRDGGASSAEEATSWTGP